MNRLTPTLGVALAAALVLAGCSAPSESAVEGELSIVASTDVYASIAAAVAGDRAVVSAIIDDPATDPHSYEATARDRLALTEADIVIGNGGGYDPFVDALLGDGYDGIVLVAVELSGLLPEDYENHDHDHADDDHDHAEEGHDRDHSEEGHDHEGHDHVEGFNEHVWYHLETAKGLASALAAALSDLDPAGATTYSSNSDVFSLEVDALIERAHELEHELGHLHVVLTEPAPQYLAELLGAHNITPEAFTSAVEAGFDVPANALLEVLRLVESGDADLVLWNEQTSGPQIERVVAAARDAGVPVVTISETLPPGTDYLSWMGSNLDAIAGVLSP